MKKITAAVLAVFMLVLLMACSATEKINIISDGGEGNGSAPVVSGTDNVMYGSWEDKLYRNSFASLSFELPDGWTAATLEEMADASSEEMITGMYAESEDNDNTISLCFENLVYTGKNELLEKDYLQIEKDEIDMFGMGYDFESEMREVSVCGSEYLRLRGNIGSEDGSICLSYYARRVSDYMVFIMVSTETAAQADELMACFK